MVRKFSFKVFNTRFGWMAVVRTICGIHTVILPKKSKEEVLSELKIIFGKKLNEGIYGFILIEKSMKKYFSGLKVRFVNKMDLSGTSKFDRSVWRAAQKIPWGQNRSYGWVSGKIRKQKAFQAVGQALSRNRLPIIIPCHRVMEKGGLLGGFNSGASLKRILLKIEGRLW